MEKLMTQISVQTLPNGYSLTVNGENFMYFSAIDLLAGFLSHVGMQQSKPMERGTILSGLFSAMIGEEYANAVTTLKARVGLLASKYEATLENMDKSVSYATSAASVIDAMVTDVNELRDKIKGVDKEHEKTRKGVKESQEKLAEILKKSEGILETLANSAIIIKAMEDVEKRKAKGNSETASVAKPGRRGRRKNDEAILREIERQSKDNPNLK